ncbi:MAG: LiaI-LiaF-like domain-containing protein [Candidatus Acidiferrales bacterium]
MSEAQNTTLAASGESRHVSCYCARCRVRSLMAPVLMITIGGLFLADQLIASIRFRHLWPIILIVIGLLKLAAYAASAEGHRARA